MSVYRVLVFGAGGPAGVNFTRSCRRAGHWVLGVDPDPRHFFYIEADHAETCPGHLEDGFTDWLVDTCAKHEIDLLHSQPEQIVMWLGDRHARDALPAKVWLPDRRTIVLCQDKFETSWRWSKAGLRPSPVIRVEVEDQLAEAGEMFGYPFWLRATRGAGARGSTPVPSHRAGISWLTYWKERGVDWEWIAEEYLPGRDFGWTSIWRNGELIISQGRERIEYIYPFLAPSGRTGTPTIAVTRHDHRVNSVAEESVREIDADATGVFCVDLREDASGTPVPTEINAGRFFTTSDFYAAAGVNFVDIYVRLGMGEEIEGLPRVDAVEENVVWMRHIDCGSRLLGGEILRI